MRPHIRVVSQHVREVCSAFAHLSGVPPSVQVPPAPFLIQLWFPLCDGRLTPPPPSPAALTLLLQQVREEAHYFYVPGGGSCLAQPLLSLAHLALLVQQAPQAVHRGRVPHGGGLAVPLLGLVLLTPLLQ